MDEIENTLSAENVIPAVLYIKEASDILKYELPAISNALLLLAKTMLDQYQVSDRQLSAAEQEAYEITHE